METTNQNQPIIRRNDTCIVCGANFEPREGKMYCSDKCKQLAYEKRKKLSQTDETEKTPILPKVSYSEYVTFCRNTANDIELPLYCFIRTKVPFKLNVNNKPNAVNIINDIIGDLDTFLDKINNLNSVLGQEYERFLIDFYSGRIEITD